jgi:uncharacterized membrane protein
MGTLQVLQDFINKYYWFPIEGDSGYNPVNTITWAIILGISIFFVAKLLMKLNIKADWKFITVIIPYIFAGSTLRVIQDFNKDAQLFSSPLQNLLVTPFIYILMFVITVVMLFISIKLQRFGIVKDWKMAFGVAGILWTLVNLGILLSVLRITNPAALIVIFLMGTGLTMLIYMLAKVTGYTMYTQRINVSILLVHLLDASSTFYGMKFLEYGEKHVVPTFLIDLAGTSSIMFPLKLMVFIPIIYVLETQFNDDEESMHLKDVLKLTIIVLGLAPATRNTVRMVLGI